jgi:hypothetical protein
VVLFSVAAGVCLIEGDLLMDIMSTITREPPVPKIRTVQTSRKPRRMLRQTPRMIMAKVLQVPLGQSMKLTTVAVLKVAAAEDVEDAAVLVAQVVLDLIMLTIPMAAHLATDRITAAIAEAGVPGRAECLF